MKKLVAIALTLCMMLTAFAALAEAPQINWADVEPQIAAAGWTGDFQTFEEIAVKLWIPSNMPAVELTEEDRANGYIGYFMTEDQSAAIGVTYVDVGGMDLAAYEAALPGVGATEIEKGVINGIEVLTYKLAENDTVVVSATTDLGYMLEIAFSPASDEGFSSVAAIITASLQGN